MSKYSTTLFLLLTLCSLFPSVMFPQSILQKMLDETIDGDTLYIEKNDYVSDNSVTLSNRNNLTLIFEEGASVTCTSQIQDIFVIQNCTDIHLYNGTFRHSISEDPKRFGSGFYIYQSQNIRLYQANIENNGVYGIFAQSNHHLELYKCLIHNNSASAFLFQEQNWNILLKGNQYDKNGTDGHEMYLFKKENTETNSIDSMTEYTLSSGESLRMDSILSIQQLMFPRIRKALKNPSVIKAEYDSLNNLPLTEQSIETPIFPAWLEKSEQAGITFVSLTIPENVRRYLCSTSGLAKFDTKDANEFFKYDEPVFTNMTPKAFLKGIQGEKVYLNDNQPSNISWNCDPELHQMVQELKTKSSQQIAQAQETVVYKLLQVWEKYQTANLTYEKLRFNLVGQCNFKRSAYNPISEMLDVPLLLGDYPIATLRISLSETDLGQLFFNREFFTAFLTIQLHPGFKQITFNSGTYDQTWYTLPNLKLLEHPVIQFMNQKGKEFGFKVYGLLDQIWADGFVKKSGENANLLTGSIYPIKSLKTSTTKRSPDKNTPLLQAGEIVNRITRSMDYYGKSMGDCYFGFASNGQKLMENLFPIEQKGKQYLVYSLMSQADADVVKKALLAKGMHFADTYSQSLVLFCYTRQLK